MPVQAHHRAAQRCEASPFVAGLAVLDQILDGVQFFRRLHDQIDQRALEFGDKAFEDVGRCEIAVGVLVDRRL